MPANHSLTSQCPQQNELRDYLLGKLPDELLQRLEQHFADCDSCEETLRGLNVADTLGNLVGKAATHDDSASDQEFVSRLVSMLQNHSASDAGADPWLRERAEEVLQHLEIDESGQFLGRMGQYRLESLIGAGSSGVVFKAVDERLERPVALKVLRPSLGPTAKQRFLLEAKAAASVDHSAVVTIYQVGEVQGMAFIAMRWLPGKTLDQELTRKTFLEEPAVKMIALQIASGLQAAHSKVLIHRDIKPANIWLTEEKQVKILDFGLARIADDDPQMTNTGMLAGTPYYMSPEQSRGQELDGRSDLFSLGCLMYRAATGKMPFGDKGILATLQSIQNHQPNPPIELNPNLSEDFSDLIMCLLEKQPANRPESAEQLVHALDSSRECWGFNAAIYRVLSNRQLLPKDVTPRAKSSWSKWVVAAVLIAMLGWCWQTYGEQIVRVVTDQGQIVVETSDDQIEIQLIADNKVVRVVDTSTEQSIDIASGEYVIQAKNLDDRNSIEIQPANVIMKRGGKQIVKITRLENNRNSMQSESAAVPATNEPLFDGKTFDQWIAQLQHERSLSAFEQGALAMGTLSADNPEHLARAIAVLRPLVRKHGSHFVGSPLHPWVPVFNKFFDRISAESVVQFAIEEIESGTQSSRNYATLLVSLGFIYEDRNELQSKLLLVVKNRLEEILPMGIELLENTESEAERAALRRAIGAAFGTARRNQNGYQFDYGGPVASPVVAMIEKQIAKTHSAEAAGFLASLLVGAESESNLAISEFAQQIGSPDIPADLRSDMIFNYLALVPADQFNNFVPGLIAIIESDEMTEQLIPRYISTLSYVSAEKVKLQSRAFTRSQVRSHLLERIGKQRGNATAALTYLDALAKRNNLMSSYAKRIASQIRGLDSMQGGGSMGSGMSGLGGGGRAAAINGKENGPAGYWGAGRGGGAAGMGGGAAGGFRDKDATGSHGAGPGKSGQGSPRPTAEKSDQLGDGDQSGKGSLGGTASAGLARDGGGDGDKRGQAGKAGSASNRGGGDGSDSGSLRNAGGPPVTSDGSSGVDSHFLEQVTISTSYNIESIRFNEHS